MTHENRKDPLTGELFTPKRFNQKFASKQNQIDFNNIKARNKRHKKLSVDKKLDKNREILILILNNDKSAIKSRDFLLGAGFNMNHFSSIHSIDKQYIYVVYEFALTLREDGNYLIKKQ